MKYNNMTIIIYVWIGSGGGSGLWFPELLLKNRKSKKIKGKILIVINCTFAFSVLNMQNESRYSIGQHF